MDEEMKLDDETLRNIIKLLEGLLKKEIDEASKEAEEKGWTMRDEIFVFQKHRSGKIQGITDAIKFIEDKLDTSLSFDPNKP